MGERGVIKNVMSFGLEVAMPDGRTGYVHMAEVAGWPEDAAQRRARFTVGAPIVVEVISEDGVALGLRPVADVTADDPQGAPSGSHDVGDVGAPGSSDGVPGDDLPPDDPDPFRETPLDAAERTAMLERLTEHMRPVVRAASSSQRTALQSQWNELRRQTTVESFRDCAEGLLEALDSVGQQEKK